MLSSLLQASCSMCACTCVRLPAMRIRCAAVQALQKEHDDLKPSIQACLQRHLLVIKETRRFHKALLHSWQGGDYST